MSAQVIVDNQEGRCKVPSVLEKELEIEWRTLPYGDYQISEDVIFERKDYSDFCTSIMDGRVFQQAKGLKENFQSPCFILEGGPDYKNPHSHVLNRGAVHGALLGITLGFNIPIIPTLNPTDTAKLIINSVKRLDKKPSSIPLQNRKKPKSLREQRRFVLESFPGVGSKMAQTIEKEYDFKPLLEILGDVNDWKVPRFGDKKKQVVEKILLCTGE